MIGTTLIVGASGATGRLLVEQLLAKGQRIKAVVRSVQRIPKTWISDENINIIEAEISKITTDQMAEYLKDCQSVASCLGHTLSIKGMYGKPRLLVTDAVRHICEAHKKSSPQHPIKLVLMNTAGNRNRDLDETISTGEKLVIGLLRVLVPPHLDNEKAADYLRTAIGQDDTEVEWVTLRPDTLQNKETVTDYKVCPSPTRSAIFNAGTTSRINVAHFMASLITDNTLWNQWKGQMPVIYNKETGK
ncbi:MAG: NAD(P)-binding oxidoreductase [Leeuwenhoekiella sp.]